MKAQHPSTLRSATICGIAVALYLSAGPVVAATDAPPPGRSIAYAFTNILWSIYQAKDASGKETKAECPDGINVGAREQFADLFPKTDGKKWKLAETSNAREAEIWWPTATPDKFPFHEASGKTALGVNLDGKIKPTDFTTPDGKPGVDNQFYRAVGCILSYREGSSQNLFDTNYFVSRRFSRTLFELTDVDSLENDDEVTITTYRGLDDLMADAKGDFQSGGTERIDAKWSQDFVHKSKGKIVNGVLMTTEPADFVWGEDFRMSAALTTLKGAHFELKLTPEKAEGVVGGYLDVDSYYWSLNRQYGTHQISYGSTPAASLYKALRRLADAYPDADTGENTAISASINIKAIQVRTIHPAKDVAETEHGADHVQIAARETSARNPAQ